LIIVLINWRVKAGSEDDFLDKWKNELSLEGSAGLIGEFLSEVEDSDFHDGITWEMEADEKDDRNHWVSEDLKSYVNVGIWTSIDTFMVAVGKYMVAGRLIKEDFEAAPRRRAVLSPKHWRIGSDMLPTETSDGVKA
jgi:heme-degrading monooxygenase HmoA